jgi:hypothetical protein
MPKRILTLISLNLLVSMVILSIAARAPAEEKNEEKKKEEASELGRARSGFPGSPFPHLTQPVRPATCRSSERGRCRCL